jgi:hypothetical protein
MQAVATSALEALAGLHLDPATRRIEQSGTVLSKLLIQTCV